MAFFGTGSAAASLVAPNRRKLAVVSDVHRLTLNNDRRSAAGGQ